MNTTDKKIYLSKSFGLFIGTINDNAMHKHYAIQLNFCVNNNFTITDKDGANRYQTCVVNSNVAHRFYSDEVSLIILINPLSTVGHNITQQYQSQHISQINTTHSIYAIKADFENYVADAITFEQLVRSITQHFDTFRCACDINSNTSNHLDEERIYKSLQYIEEHHERVIPLAEIADVSCLSSSRFLHLFKEQTGIAYRRYQLWNKLIKSLSHLDTHSITETAHSFGFTDSSHYSRTFKETFGFSPKFIARLKS